MHRRKVPRRTRGYRSAMTGFLRSDGVLVFTPSFRQEYIDRFGIAPERIDILPMTIDTERFSPDRNYLPMRPEFGIPDDAIVVGIVTRFQKYRRMDVFVEAAARVIAARKNVYFLLLGWSGQIEDTVIKPIRENRVEKNVLLAGYRIDDYEDTLACMDIFTLLMPGFDGTARAVREAMAMGKPCVVSDIGMLPEIVEHGQTGLVTPLTVDGLSNAWLTLVDDAKTRKLMGTAALQTARSRFKLDNMAEHLEQSYRKWQALKR
jgi:glycosyltransferase involved in cell wall biosynthesis